MTQNESKEKAKLHRSFDQHLARSGHKGWWTYNIATITGQAGTPDMTFVRDGVVVWIEVKIRSRPLTRTQKVTMGRMAEAGARVVVLRCLGGDEGYQLCRFDGSFSVRAPDLSDSFWYLVFNASE